MGGRSSGLRWFESTRCEGDGRFRHLLWQGRPSAAGHIVPDGYAPASVIRRFVPITTHGGCGVFTARTRAADIA